MQCLHNVHTYMHTFIAAPFAGLFIFNILKLQDTCKTKEKNVIFYMKKKPDEINY